MALSRSWSTAPMQEDKYRQVRASASPEEQSFIDELQELAAIVSESGSGLSVSELRIRARIARAFIEESSRFDLLGVDPSGEVSRALNEFRSSVEMLELRIADRGVA